MGLTKKELCKRLEIVDNFLLENSINFNTMSLSYEHISFLLTVIPGLEKYYFSVINLNQPQRVSALKDFVLQWIVDTSNICYPKKSKK